MKKTVISLSLIATFAFGNGSNSFNEKVEQFMTMELDKIPKPPQNIELTKDEFETTQEFNARVAKTKKDQSASVKTYEEQVANSKAQAKENAIKNALRAVWGRPLLSNLRYDADNGYFVADLSFEANNDFSKSVAIKVDRANAVNFKQQFTSLKPQAVFDYSNGSVALKDIRIPYGSAKQHKMYTSQFTDMKADETRVAVNLKSEFTPQMISSDVKVGDTQVSSFDTSKLQDFNELDRLLASTQAVPQDHHKWLFSIGIEKYANTDAISYATRTAEMFTKIGEKRLGVPQENSYVLINEGATQAKIKTAFNKLLARVKTGDTLYFYYNGHGVPIANQNFEPYMLAQDSDPDYIGDERFFALNNIYGILSASKASKVIAIVDSCFSGVTDGKSVLKGVAATKMKPKVVDFNKDKMVVLTAGKDYQYSNGYDKKGYRMFSFFAMKDLLSNNLENKPVKDFYKEIKSETYDASLQEYGDNRTQEPTISGNESLDL